MFDMRRIVGRFDILFVTLDTLRYDVAEALLAQGRTPHLGAVLPGGRWEKRHTPASFTYPAHLAFFAGFLPTPVTPGPHPRLFAAAFPGTETTGDGTWVFDGPDLVGGLAKVGYHTVAIGGVGFFNRRSALGSVLPGMFAEDHWRPDFGVTEPDSLRYQLDVVQEIVARTPTGTPLFLFLNVSALHQPNRHYLPGATEDTVESHAKALEYVDAQIGRLFAAMRPGCFVIMCSDHGTAYGEGGHVGHRTGHEVVWTVPYAEFQLP
jgi:arylsulfatase A-like enzyme